MGQDEEDIENPEGCGEDGEEIDGDEVFGMVMQEGGPSLAGPLASRAILTEGGIGNGEAKLGQFSVET